MSFTQIPSLVAFSPLTTILSADVNANYAAIRNAFNGLVTGSNTIAVDTITENTAANGVTINKAATFSAGVATFASGIAITGGIVSGVATFSSGFAISGGVVSGLATFSSGIVVTGTAALGGALTVAAGMTVSATGVFTSGIAITGGVLTSPIGTGTGVAKSPQVFAQGFLGPGTTSGSYQTIQSATLLANSLSASGTQFSLVAQGVCADATSWNLRWSIGSTVILTATQTASATFSREAIVTRTGATTANIFLRHVNGGTVSMLASNITGLDLTADQTVSLAFVTSTSTGNLTLENYAMKVETA